MRSRHLALPAITLIAAAALAQAPQAPHDKLPLWAYPDHFSQASSAANRAEVEHLPGSKASYTKAEIGDLFVVPDWYPDIHPPMPDVVAHGRKPDVYACGHCHLPNGQGRPENASVTGLPEAYIVQQMADFKSGLRTGSDPDMLSVTNMVKLSKSISDEDVKAAAAYFSSFKLKPWIRVVEVEQVPKTKPEGGMMVVVGGGGPSRSATVLLKSQKAWSGLSCVIPLPVSSPTFPREAWKRAGTWSRQAAMERPCHAPCVTVRT